jgi:hypothetical protein
MLINYRLRWQGPILNSSKMDLWLALKNLQATLFNDQPLSSKPLSNPFCAPLIPILHFVCSTLYYVRKGYPLTCSIC